MYKKMLRRFDYTNIALLIALYGITILIHITRLILFMIKER